MLNFDIPRYEKVIKDALALRPEIEKAADEIHNKGYKNIFFIGVGGTYAHYLPFKYFLDSRTEVENHVVIAAEFMAAGHKRFSKDSLCVFSTRSGNTKEIVAAAEYCKKHGATVVSYVSNEGTPIWDYSDYIFHAYAEDDHLGESIYLTNIPFIARLMYNAGYFDDYNKFVDQLSEITPYLIKAKESYEPKVRELALKHKDTPYHLVVGSGSVWGEAYDYAMCILEEMQWINAKSIHAAEFFHGTLEVVVEGTSMIMFYGEDETRPLMDRVYNFASQITDNFLIFDTKDVELPVDEKFRPLLSAMLIYVLTERFSANLAEVRNHPLTTRRYYRQMEY